ncbi:MAG: fatty acid desaturase [Sandaracinaceae bacterium]|nr:fatty acid desaturase [Sandaracinaceae bacterium]
MRHRSDLRALLYVAAHYGLAAFGMITYRSMSTWQVVAVFVAMCLSCFVMATIVHNTLHVPVFRSRALNKLYQVVLTVGQGHPVSAFVPGHNFSHHLHTATARDIMRPTQLTFRWNLLNQLLFFFRVVPEIMSSERRWAAKMRRENPAWFRQYLIENAALYTMRISLLLYDFWAGVIFIAIPHFYGHWGVVGANVYQHDGCVVGHEHDHSRSFTGWLLNFVLFNNGYHAAHHMKPGLHWSQLPDYHAKHVAPHAHPALIQRSIIAYLWRACIYPGKRVDLDGNPISPRRTESEDWVAGVERLDREVLATQLGADALQRQPEPAE